MDDPDPNQSPPSPRPPALWRWFIASWGAAAALFGLTVLSEHMDDGSSGPNFSGPFLLLLLGALIATPIVRTALEFWRRRGPTRRAVALGLGVIVAALAWAVGGGAWHVLQLNRCGAMSVFEQSEFRGVIAELSRRTAAGAPMPQSITQLIHDGTFGIRRISRGCTTRDLTTVAFGPYTGRSIARQRMSRTDLDAEIARQHPSGPPAWERFGPLTICLDPRPYATDDLMIIVACWPTEDAILEGQSWTHIALANGQIRAAFGGPGEPWELEALENSIAFYDTLGIPMPEQMVADLRAALHAR